MDLHQRHLWSGRLKTGRRKQNKKNFGDFFFAAGRFPVDETTAGQS